MPECIVAAFIPLERRLSTWSFIKEIRGVITKVMPLSRSPGTWKQMLLPPPVGNSPMVS